MIAAISHGTSFVRLRSKAMVHGPENALKLRSLAARMRGHAADTHIELYRRKFELTARELEEAAVNEESRCGRPNLRQVS
jgi:hypothetical protein